MGNGTSPSTYNHSVLTEYQESSESCRQGVLREEENLAHEHYCKLKINNESNTHFKLGVMTLMPGIPAPGGRGKEDCWTLRPEL